MEHNTAAVSIINPALLPNFLFLLALFLMMAFLWYHFDYKNDDDPTRGPKDPD